jgi:hypothetical protein
MMLGAIIGDIVGSVYEWHNIKTKDFPLFDIQMVRSAFIKERVLDDHGITLDRTKADEVCLKCPYNQLQGLYAY